MGSFEDSSGSVPLLSKSAIEQLTRLRHHLHATAEVSGREHQTSNRVKEFLKSLGPDEIKGRIGGHGLAAFFRGESSSQTVLLRADLDALPIPETLALDYGSKTTGVSHKCGHDGHMAMLCGVACWLSQNKKRPFDVVIFFQPEEETGQGAAKVLKEPLFDSLDISYVFALHNLPGFPLGRVVTSDGVFASASKGLVVDLIGRTSHAAEPHRGNSPTEAFAALIQGLSAIPQHRTALGEAAKVTVVHAKLGEPAFGTSPGHARVAATLRTHSKSTMRRLEEYCENHAEAAARSHNLKSKLGYEEEFPLTENSKEAADIIEQAADSLGLSRVKLNEPFPWSEDFGHFTNRFKGAMFGLGSGEDCPALHNPEYDFPDALIPIGANIFISIIEQVWRTGKSV